MIVTICFSIKFSGQNERFEFCCFRNQDGDGELKLDEVKRMVENENQVLGCGMAFVPEAPSVCQALPAFAPRKKKPEKERKVKKTLVDVRKSMMTMLRPKFEHELNSDDVENMRWATFVEFNRKVGNVTVMTGKANIVQVKQR